MIKIIHAREPFPNRVTKTIFLAGPTPRNHSNEKEKTGWRSEAISILEKLGFDGYVFSPETKDCLYQANYLDQIGWEEEGLHRADCIVFWIPRDINGTKLWDFPMPGLTTNDEWGAWKSSGKVVLGSPINAVSVKYQEHYAKKFGAPVSKSLTETLQNAINIIGTGAERNDGECCVPLYVWNKPEFQSWYLSLKKAGNALNNARVIWTFLGSPQNPFGYALHTNIHVSSEFRNKTNEFVLFRPDIFSVLLYHEDKIVLVREFRSPVRNAAGFVFELPGGSSKSCTKPVLTAIQEVEEETGLKLTPERLIEHDGRQLLATFSAHTAKLFSAKLTADEMAKLERDTEAHGFAEDSERTYIEVKTLKNICESNLLDWSTLGMIYSVLG